MAEFGVKQLHLLTCVDALSKNLPGLIADFFTIFFGLFHCRCCFCFQETPEIGDSAPTLAPPRDKLWANLREAEISPKGKAETPVKVLSSSLKTRDHDSCKRMSLRQEFALGVLAALQPSAEVQRELRSSTKP
jgi:hypothetical protein